MGDRKWRVQVHWGASGVDGAIGGRCEESMDKSGVEKRLRGRKSGEQQEQPVLK